MSDEDFLIQIQKEFLEEATFFLSDCEESYLKLEEPESRTEEINKIFRLAHTLKGAGAAVGFADLSAFAHKVEDYLTLLKANTDAIDTEVISLLLQCGDKLKERIEHFKEDLSGKALWQTDDLVEKIKVASAKIPNGAISSVSAEVTPESSASNAIPSEPTEPMPQVSILEPATPQSPQTKTESNAVLTAPEEEKTSPLTPEATPPQNSHPKIKPSKSSEENAIVKVEAEKVERVLNVVGELVVLKSQLLEQCSLHSQDLRLTGIASQMDKIIRELQDRTLSMRMTPLKSLFLKTQRVLRDLSVKLDKPIDFEMIGEDVEVDRSVVDLLADPMLHIARNALDHGIEKPALRKERGKNPRGKIWAIAAQRGDRIEITIKDDGGGLKKDKIVAKAIERGILPQGTDVNSVPDNRAFGLIFEAGFSTAEVVTDVSGRGVGMDVVRTNIERLRGNIRIESKPGEGSSFIISLPLTAAITDGMIVEISKTLYVLPTDQIIELFENNESIVLGDGNKTLRHRNRVFPTLSLAEIFHGNRPAKEMFVLVKAGEKEVALGVTRVVGQAQVVLKSLKDSFGQIQGVGGAAILGNGRVALVIEPESLLNLVSHRGVSPLHGAQA